MSINLHKSRTGRSNGTPFSLDHSTMGFMKERGRDYWVACIIPSDDAVDHLRNKSSTNKFDLLLDEGLQWVQMVANKNGAFKLRTNKGRRPHFHVPMRGELIKARVEVGVKHQQIVEAQLTDRGCDFRIPSTTKITALDILKVVGGKA